MIDRARRRFLHASLAAGSALAMARCPALAEGTLEQALASRPDETVIKAATADGRRGRVRSPSGIIGLSDPSTLDPRVIALAVELGVKWIRAEFHWSQIQPGPGATYQWERYDRMVAACNAAGINVLGIITYIPQWMPSDWAVIDAQFQVFVAALVERYAKSGVHSWEIFNEPNLPGFGWLVKGVRPEDFVGCYTLLLARANRIIRQWDPAGIVVLGGLSPDGMPPERFMAELYRLGGKDCFDVFAFHPYGYQNKFAAANARVRSIMAAGGDTAGKPIWFDEYGMTDVSQQSAIIENVFKDRHNADALFWFSIKDFRSSGSTFGLVDNGYARRSGFATFERLVRAAR